MTQAPIGVLHLCAGNLYGGVERIVAECARSRALCASMRPSFAVAFDGRLAQEIESAGVRCERLGAARLSRPLTILRARRALARVLAGSHPDAVICHSSWIYAIAAPVVRRTPAQLAIWIHDRVSGRPWPERWARLTPPDMVICNSRFTAATVPQMFPASRTDLVYAPVAAGDDISADSRAALRRSLGAAADEVVIAMASRFEEWKGHRPLVDALCGLQGGWRAWIAGAPQRPHERELAASLRARIASAGLTERVQFLGERRDVAAVLRAADVHCQPNSGPEPFGLAFVEALYAGLPVVTTAMGGATEIVTGDTGILVPPGDVPALRAALQQLVNEPARRRALGAGGPARARLLCDPARQLQALRDLFTPVVALHASA
jgi:glycosyltransferase involved in cell wall biosynthesis